MTNKQKTLADKHGTPENFNKALLKAVTQGMVNLNEASVAMHQYQTEWDEAGLQTFDCLAVMEPGNPKPICIALEQDELEACLDQRGISKTEVKKRRFQVFTGKFTVLTEPQ